MKNQPSLRELRNPAKKSNEVLYGRDERDIIRRHLQYFLDVPMFAFRPNEYDLLTDEEKKELNSRIGKFGEVCYYEDLNLYTFSFMLECTRHFVYGAYKPDYYIEGKFICLVMK